MQFREYVKMIASSLLAATIFASSGCLGWMHPITAPEPELLECCHSLPCAARSHVHIFLVNGIDTPNCANLTGVRDYLVGLGYSQTYYCQCFHPFWYKSEIRRIHKEDPEARFVLIGYCLGANCVRSLTYDLQADQINVDLLVYLDGKPLSNDPHNRPENALHIVSILSHGWPVWQGQEIDGVENITLDNADHFDAPTDPRTLETLAQEITQVASQVHYVIHGPAEAQEPEATPRPVKTPTVAAQPDKWDFLKPVENLNDRAAVLRYDATPEKEPQHDATAKANVPQTTTSQKPNVELDDGIVVPFGRPDD